MKWQIGVIGKPSLAYAKTGVAEYLKRLGRYTNVELQCHWKDAGPEKNSDHLSAFSEGGIRIVSDERGECWTTRQLARQVEAWQVGGEKKVSLLIGGADGHHQKLRDRADLVLGLSAYTMQHELALLVWLEQLYRVHTLLKGEPYHRD